MTPQRDEKRELSAWGVLIATLMLPLQAAGAFLFQGCYALFGQQLLGFWRLGIAPATGAAAVRAGAVLTPLGLAFALVTYLGLRYALSELHTGWRPRR